jgi:hypothetical protein
MAKYNSRVITIYAGSFCNSITCVALPVKLIKSQAGEIEELREAGLLIDKSYTGHKGHLLGLHVALNVMLNALPSSSCCLIPMTSVL